MNTKTILAIAMFVAMVAMPAALAAPDTDNNPNGNPAFVYSEQIDLYYFPEFGWIDSDAEPGFSEIGIAWKAYLLANGNPSQDGRTGWEVGTGARAPGRDNSH